MKKLFLLYFLGAFLLAASQTVEAKKYLKVSQPLSSVSKEALIQKNLAEKMALPSKSMISTLDAAEISKLNPEIDPGISSFEKIQELNAKLNEEINQALQPLFPGIFKAASVDMQYMAGNEFSGFIFSTVYKGKKEIYGAIATHSLAETEKELLPFSLHQKFFATFLDRNGAERRVPVEVVAVSPKSMLDIALVKFPKEIEPLLVPYQLGSLEHENNLSSAGYSVDGFFPVASRTVISKTPFSIRTDFPAPPKQRSGLCGSPIFNKKGEVVALHTGSTKNRQDPDSDRAYGTPSNYLNNLVKAYHQEEATLPFYVNGQKIAEFGLNEYIFYVALADEGKNQIWQYWVPFKFSYSKLLSALGQNPQAKFLIITTRNAAWSDNGFAFIEDKSIFYNGTETAYIYDLENQKLLLRKEYPFDKSNRSKNTSLLFHNVKQIY